MIVKNSDCRIKPVCRHSFRMIETCTSKHCTRSPDNKAQMDSNSQSTKDKFAGCRSFLHLTTPVSHFCKRTDVSVSSRITTIQPMLVDLSRTGAQCCSAIVPPVLMVIREWDCTTLKVYGTFHHLSMWTYGVGCGTEWIYWASVPHTDVCSWTVGTV